MTIQELCDKLLAAYQTRYDDVLKGETGIEDSDFPVALTDAWLADNVKAVFEIMSRKEASQAELVGELEINAFLASFQKMYEGSRRTRAQRWAGNYQRQKAVLDDGGPLKAQLRHIGVKVEDEWLADVIPLGGVV